VISGLLRTGDLSVFNYLTLAVNSMYLVSYRAVQTGPGASKP
jgi:hypothetical protein